MNPVVLYDNRLLDGTPTATDTATGYDVLNVRDLREFTSWKGASLGTKYITVDCGSAKSADALGIKRHNLGTASASVSVESSDNGTDWTERLAPFAPSNDKAILKTFTSASARYWRIKVVTAATAPEIAVALVGVRVTFPYPPDGPYVPASTGIEADVNRGRTGMLLGTTARFKPYKISPRWSNPTRSWVDAYFVPFWDDHASNLSPFFYAWDLDTYPNDVRFVSVPADSTNEMPMSTLAYYDSVSLPMEGVKE